jgi:hypothetical protein
MLYRILECTLKKKDIAYIFLMLYGLLGCMLNIHSSNPYCLLNYTELNHHTKLNHY